YSFEDISFPTSLRDILKFEKNNLNISVNVYGLENKLKPPKKFSSYEVFPLKFVDNEKRDHFDLLLVTDNNNTHYTYISNFSIRSQKTSHEGQAVFCKRCFTSFDKQNLKYKLRGQAALEHHKLICGPHKPIRPKMPSEGEVLEFTAWQNTQRHLIVIYADFEALLIKANERKEKILQSFKNIASEDVPTKLLREFNIPTEPVIYRGSESRQDVAKHFIENTTDVAEKIEKLMETNIILNMSDEDNAKHNSCFKCNLCKCAVNTHSRVRDHDHLTGKFRQTLCNRCNLSLKQPKYVPVFLHNLSNYGAHFIITELDYNSKKINVTPNSKEKFVDTIRFMSTRLSTLAANLVTPDLEKFLCVRSLEPFQLSNAGRVFRSLFKNRCITSGRCFLKFPRPLLKHISPRSSILIYSPSIFL
ncbi:Uncharacterized protein FWK35_00020464, partial [Aphis craccivora]